MRPPVRSPLNEAITGGGWHDAATRAEAWGGIACQPTARAHGSTRFARLDHAIVNMAMVPLIVRFAV
eukprot:7075051-Alexandrium_andersonii.AAC.1